MVDIFKSASIERADISILDDDFLQTFKDKPNENLRLKLLEKLMADEIQRLQKKNLARAKTFRSLLEETIRKYHNRLIDAADVIRAMIEMRSEWQEADTRAAALDLSDEELAFYESVDANYHKRTIHLREINKNKLQTGEVTMKDIITTAGSRLIMG